ncbi:MAG: hypothetical protein AMXMBFR64_51440 [Myxococcales bacterium]
MCAPEYSRGTPARKVTAGAAVRSVTGASCSSGHETCNWSSMVTVQGIVRLRCTKKATARELDWSRGGGNRESAYRIHAPSGVTRRPAAGGNREPEALVTTAILLRLCGRAR